MTGFDRSVGILRHLSPSGLGESQLRHKLTTGEVTIGRAFGCEIVLDSDEYGMVSRRHAAVRPVNAGNWEICDLNSANGTYVNGDRLQGCRKLQAGDRIQLGKNGPEFIFEYNPDRQTPGSFYSTPTPAATPPIATPAISNPSAGLDGVTISQLFPILSTGRQLKQKAFLMPAIATVGFVVLMFTAVGEPLAFNMLLAAYLAGAAYYFVYQLCGKRKPWWVLLASALTTVLILISPLLQVFLLIFREFLPGSVPTETESVSFPVLLVRMFFGAGLMEELLKALPVVAAYLLAHKLPSPWRERIGVWEPLDGILLGAASAVGFTLLETLGQYVPEAIQNVTFQAGDSAGQLVGLQLLIPRIMGSVAGHMAYSGYFGYFIGLSVLKPRNFWKILGVGYLSAAGLHALWNATGFFSGVGLALVGVLSYAFLAAAILKARALSPTRSQNFATRFITRP